MEIKILKNILNANDQIAAENRQKMDGKGVFAVNIMSSPGAGKTSLILETARRLQHSLKIAVIEGDVASSIDAERIGAEGVTVVQINTEERLGGHQVCENPSAARLTSSTT